MRKILILILFIYMPAVLWAQDTAYHHYKIYDVKGQKTVSLEDLVKDFKNYDVLFFGEEHNDAMGHALEAELFKKISLHYPKPALAMEMFYTDTQPVIDEYLADIISEKNFIKECRVWDNYDDYRPLIEFAKENHLVVIGGNAATRYSNAVTRSGLEVLKKLPAQSKAFLPPLPIDTATGRYLDKFIETLGGHGMENMKIYQTQNLWDATMAWSIYKYAKDNKGKKIFQINGRFHSDEQLGIVAQLKKYDPELKILNISCFSSDDFNAPEWNKYKSLGDYIIITNPKL